jgi:putative membrane-bound dehydrogenase-like protein
VILVAGLLSLHAHTRLVCAQEIARPSSPVLPGESIRHLELHPDLRIELVACEPDVIDPVALAFDEHGRLWVAEMSDYPNGDPATPRSRIRLLEDTDNDGRFETSHVFADKLLFANGIQPWKNGVIVTVAGKVMWLNDTDGDHKADVFQTWFTGFAEENPQLRANHPTLALDNHIYIANGLRGGAVVGTQEKWLKACEPVSISGRDFRFDPLSGRYEAITGVGQFGLTFDDDGNRFVCSNRNPCKHIILEEQYLANNRQFAAPQTFHDVSPPGEASRVYAINRPWTTSTLHAGQFTAACGVTIFRGNGLPRSFVGNSFTCEPTGSLIHRDVLTKHGVTFTSQPGRKKKEFLASRDDWFRAVNLAQGPDGALYVADMYRAVIEHPQFMPTELKQRPDLTKGNDRGRVYRIVDKTLSADELKRRRTSLADHSAAQLVKLLDHANAWHRETAARLIYERQDASAVEPLMAMAIESPTARTRTHAMYALSGLNALTPEILAERLASSEPDARHALRLAEPLLTADPAWAEFYAFHATGNDPGTRFQAALSLAKTPRTPQVLAALARLATDPKSNEWIQSATLTSIGDRPLDLLRHSLSILRSTSRTDAPGSRWLVSQLCRLVAVRNKPEEISAAIELAVSGTGALQTSPGELRLEAAMIFGLGAGLKGRNFQQRISKQPDLQNRSLNLFQIAIQVAANTDQPSAIREECLALLKYAAFDQASPVLTRLAFHSPDNNIRIAAINSLSDHRSQDLGPLLLPDFSARTPSMQRSILNALLATPARTRTLLKEIESGKLSVTRLDVGIVNRLTRHPSPDIRSTARKLLADAIPKDRAAVLDKYKVALTMDADAKRGRLVFQKNCANCHRIGDIGVNVAPDIADSRTKTPQYLLTNILDPNRAIDSNYFSYTIVDKDGKLFTGIISAESATSVTMRQAENKTLNILRSNIDQISSNGISLMPVGVERNVSEQDMADLISFIKNWRYLDGSVPIGTGG